MIIGIDIDNELARRLFDYANESKTGIDKVIERLIATLPVRANFKIPSLTPEEESNIGVVKFSQGDRSE